MSSERVSSAWVALVDVAVAPGGLWNTSRGTSPVMAIGGVARRPEPRLPRNSASTIRDLLSARAED